MVKYSSSNYGLIYLVAIITIVIFGLNIPNFLFSSGIFVSPKFWIMGWWVAICLVITLRFELISRVFATPLILYWVGGYIALTLLGYLWSQQTDAVWGELRIRLTSALFFLSCIFLFRMQGNMSKLGWPILFIAITAVGFNLYEMLNPLEFINVNGSLGRSAGLYMNPNVSGIMLVIMLMVLLQIFPRSYWLGLFILIGVGLLPTFSRGSIILYFILIYLSLARVNIKSIGTLSTTVLLVVVSSYITFNTMTELPEWGAEINPVNTFDRLMTIESGGDYQGRQELIISSIERISENPLVGRGLGSETDYDTGSHNVYLRYMLDYGVLGVFVFPLFLFSVAHGNYGLREKWVKNAMIVMLIVGVFSHNILDNRSMLLLTAMLSEIIFRSSIVIRNSRLS